MYERNQKKEIRVSRSGSLAKHYSFSPLVTLRSLFFPLYIYRWQLSISATGLAEYVA